MPETKNPLRLSSRPFGEDARQGLEEPDRARACSRARTSCANAWTSSRRRSAGSTRSRRRSCALEKRVAALEKRSRRAAKPKPETSAGNEARRPASSGPELAARAGTSSNAAGVVPTCSPSTSIGRCSAASTADVSAAQDLHLRVRDVAAPVDLRCRRQEVGLRDVADQHDVEQAVVGLGVGGELHPAAVPHAVRDDHVVHPAPALAAVEP